MTRILRERSRRDNKEERLHLMVAQYIKQRYPDVLFTSEGSGVRVSFSQAKILKRLRSCSGLPDMLIFKPNSKYHGLFLELKHEGASPYKKDGKLRSTDHVQAQAAVLNRLLDLGYKADYGIGFEDTVEKIDSYMQII